MNKFLFIFVFLLGACASEQRLGEGRVPAALADRKHVHLMHVDGFRPDVFQALLKDGRLPNFAALINRGQVSYQNATVDKTETMKVIQSYLTGRRDTKITGWWQWEDFAYRNSCMDPVDVLKYELGLEFSGQATAIDYSSKSEGYPIGGFNLYRRGIDFDSYSRNFVEGAKGVFYHKFLDQANATMDSLLKIYDKRAAKRGPYPHLAVSLLAAADEFGHEFGITSDAFKEDYCFERVKPEERQTEPKDLLFELQDSIPNYNKYFTVVSANRLCTKLPHLGGKTYGAPGYTLGMMLIDMEVGKLVRKLKSLTINANDQLEALPKPSEAEDTLFKQTLFMITSDHGYADSSKGYGNANPDSHDLGLKIVQTEGKDHTFIDELTEHLKLETYKANTKGVLAEIGIDDSQQPDNIKFPHLDPSWQNQEIRSEVKKAREWATNFVSAAEEEIVDKLYAKYTKVPDPKAPGRKDKAEDKLRYLQNTLAAAKYREVVIELDRLRRLLLRMALGVVFNDRMFHKGLGKQKQAVTETLAHLYLMGNPEYVLSEREALQKYYDKHVRLVYGGAARNNAELFLPGTEDGQYTWGKRPTYKEIMSYKGGTRSQTTLIKSLQTEVEGVDLIFVRESNVPTQARGTKQAVEPMMGEMKILVTNTKNQRAHITVKRHPNGELLFAYEVTSGDPLKYGFKPGDKWWGNFDAWNKRSIEKNHLYHNVVAGMGTYLYSNNGSIGDITLMHEKNWNFGSNGGGHGGVHRDESVGLMIVSGPGTKPGAGKDTLQAKARHTLALSQDENEVFNKAAKEDWAYPTVVDVAPSIVKWLYQKDRGELTTYSRSDEFKNYLGKWAGRQRADMIKNFHRLNGIQNAVREAGLEDFNMETFKPFYAQLLKFIPEEPPAVPQTIYIEDGNLLDLDYGQ